VKIDPSLTRNPSADTYVNSGAPNSSHGPGTELHAGKLDSGEGYCRTLVKFDISSLPAGAYVRSANIKLYEFYSGGGGATTTYVGSMARPPSTSRS